MTRSAALALALVLAVGSAARADDDAVAYRLWREGRHAESAELFRDPAWKAAALYRSGQLWRAAEIWVRLDGPDAAFNLGDAYARLGYTELALEAFLRAGTLRPGFEEARRNAELMREILAAGTSDGGGGTEPGAREIDRLDTERSGDSAPEEGEDGGARDAGEGAPPAGGRDAGDDRGEGAAAGSDRSDGPPAPERTGAGGGVDGGRSTDEPADPTAPASADGSGDVRPGDAASRRRLEDAQAAEQWLSTLAIDHARYLGARIALEARRREAAGTLAPAGDSPW
jgi:Ca-activated chloride channel homolog